MASVTPFVARVSSGIDSGIGVGQPGRVGQPGGWGSTGVLGALRVGLGAWRVGLGAWKVGLGAWGVEVGAWGSVDCCTHTLLLQILMHNI